MTRAMLLLLLAGLCALLVTSCGHSRRMAATSLPTETTLKAATNQPVWLADILKELEAMPCPMNVQPEVFARIKARRRWTGGRSTWWTKPAPFGRSDTGGRADFQRCASGSLIAPT